MALNDSQEASGQESGVRETVRYVAATLVARLTRMRAVLIAAGIVLAALALFGSLHWLDAVVGYAVFVFAVLLVADDELRRGALPAAVYSLPAIDITQIEAIIAGIPDPVIVLERDGRVLTYNSGARQIAPALGRGGSLSLALRVPDIVEAVRRVAISRIPEQVEYSERVPVDRWFAAHITPIALAPRAEANLLLLVFHDLTPLRRVEEMRADFIANASHELRTPLAALSGFIDTLQGPARDDPAARERFLAIMKEQAARMARLIDDLLSLSRIELNEHVQPSTPIDLAPIVRQVADSLQMLARERGVEIGVKRPTEPLLVAGERDELTRVFENLIENALKYGASGKRVEIGFSRAAGTEGAEAVVSVRDFGPGIAAEHLPRLTERFYRIDVGQSRAEGGTGLGLALCKHILNRHRGRLMIESQVGQGATFIARLPLTDLSGPEKKSHDVSTA